MKRYSLLILILAVILIPTFLFGVLMHFFDKKIALYIFLTCIIAVNVFLFYRYHQLTKDSRKK
jgi:membrane-anchored glycerophosphoryl diester phosphodiesterase (GDPDase)